MSACSHRVQSMTGSQTTPNWCTKCSLWFDDAEHTIVTIALPTAIDEPRGCPTPGACSCPSRDSAVNDTAEAIKSWLTGPCEHSDGHCMQCATERIDRIRAGAWRGQNGGE